MSINVNNSQSGLSIVIPIFNEEDNITGLFKKIKKFSEDIHFPYEFILVDGNSSDDSPNRIDKLIQSNHKIKISLIKMNKKVGYGHDIVAGLNAAQFDFMCWTHADLQTDINDLKEAYNLIINVNDEVIVKGNRGNRSLIPTFFTFAMQIFVFFKLKVSLNDINAQPKVFSRNFYEKFLRNEAPDDFSLDLYLLRQGKINNIPILEFPVSFNKRKAGIAKGGGGSWKNRKQLIKRTIKYINKLSADKKNI